MTLKNIVRIPHNGFSCGTINNMWLKFTERAKQAVYHAQEAAQQFGEGYVSTEHLLLGIVKEPSDNINALLALFNVKVERIRAEIERQLPRGDARPSKDMTLTPRAKRVIDLAYDEARTMECFDVIKDEHLFLGLIREGDGLAGRVLAKLGIELEKAREFLIVREKLTKGSALVGEKMKETPKVAESAEKSVQVPGVKVPSTTLDFAEVIKNVIGSQEKSVALLKAAKLETIEAVSKIFDDLIAKAQKVK